MLSGRKIKGKVVGANAGMPVIPVSPKNGNVINPFHFASPKQYRSSQFYGFFRPKEETPDNKEIDITKPPKEGQPNVNPDQTLYNKSQTNKPSDKK